MSKIVILFPVFENYLMLKNAIESVDLKYHIVIVDNSKNRSTISYPNRNITLISTKPNIGFGRACNIGIAEAKKKGYTKAIICNQDVVFQENTIDQLINGLSKFPKSILLPLVYQYKSEAIEEYTLKSYGNSFSRDLIKKEVKEHYEIENTGLCCFAINLNLLDKTPLFDPLFFMYWEDTDFIQRAKLDGHSLILLPSATIHHDANESDRDNYRDKSTFRISKAIFDIRWKKHPLLMSILQVKKGGLKYFLKLDLKESLSFLKGVFYIFSKLSSIKKYSQNELQERIDHFINKDRKL